MSDDLNLKRLNKTALKEWLEDKAAQHSAKSNALLDEAYHLKIHLPHCQDPWADSKRIQECEALAAQHLLFCVGFRIEKQALEAKS